MGAGRVEAVVGQERHRDELAGLLRPANPKRSSKSDAPTATMTLRSAGGGGLPSVPAWSAGNAASRSVYGAAGHEAAGTPR